MEKLKADVLDGPQIHTLIKIINFTNHMTQFETEGWLRSLSFIKHFSGNHKAPENCRHNASEF